MADEVLPTDEKRAADYSKVNLKDQPLKYLHQDGSVDMKISVISDSGSANEVCSCSAGGVLQTII